MNVPIMCFVNGGFVLEFGGCIMSFPAFGSSFGHRLDFARSFVRIRLPVIVCSSL